MNPTILGVIGPGFPNQVPTLVGSGGTDYGDDCWGKNRDYYRDPFPHSLLSNRQSFRGRGLGFRRALGIG